MNPTHREKKNRKRLAELEKYRDELEDIINRLDSQPETTTRNQKLSLFINKQSKVKSQISFLQQFIIPV